MTPVFKKVLVLFLLGVPLAGFAQSNSEKAAKKGNIIIDVYIGGPQILTRTRFNTYNYKQTSKGFGPIGGRVEYMLSQKSSLGIEANYATSTITTTYEDVVFNDRLETEDRATRMRFFPRYALHFGGRKLDAYWHIGAGVALWNIDHKVTDPSETVQPEDVAPKSTGPRLRFRNGPTLAFRTGVGLRYFFTDNFGLNADFGLGGALFTFGLTGKF